MGGKSEVNYSIVVHCSLTRQSGRPAGCVGVGQVWAEVGPGYHRASAHDTVAIGCTTRRRVGL